MKKIFSLLVLTLLIISNITAQVNFIQNIKARNLQNLDGHWHYIIDPYETGDNNNGNGFYLNKQPQSKSELIEYDFERSPTLKVPGDWNSQDDKLLFYEGTIWYEHDFNVAIKPGKRYFLNFGAVNYEAHVYLNGKKLGIHVGGFHALNLFYHFQNGQVNNFVE